MSRLVAPFLALILLGCGDDKQARKSIFGQPESQGETKKVEKPKTDIPFKPPPKEQPKAEPKPQPKPEDPKVAAYKKAMPHFIEEARSLAKSAELVPSFATWKKRREQVEEAFTRLPDPPAQFEPVQKEARGVLDTLYLAEVDLGFVYEFAKLRTGEAESKKCLDKFKKAASDLLNRLRTLESKVSG